jgi:hypothetical protein
MKRSHCKHHSTVDVASRAWVILLFGLLLGSAYTAEVAAQIATIPDQLARAGRSLSGTSTIPSGPIASLDSVLRSTDVIVRGIVGRPQSYLAKNQREIQTDYPLSRPVVLYRTASDGAAAPETEDIRVTLSGGTVRINGLAFTWTPSVLPGLEPGSEGLFLLRRVGTKYMVAGGHYGAFRIVDAQLLPLTRKKGGFAYEFRHVPAEDAVTQILTRRLKVTSEQ